MVINVQRFKGKSSNKRAGFKSPVIAWFRSLFANVAKPKSNMGKSLKPATIMY